MGKLPWDRGCSQEWWVLPNVSERSSTQAEEFVQLRKTAPRLQTLKAKAGR